MNFRSHLIRVTVITTTGILIITACGGRKADPVATYQMGDENLSCDGIRAELAFIDQQVATLLPESKKAGKNTALGVAGVFLIVPWFFMDVSDSERVEIDAYKKRYIALQQIGIKKGCDAPGGAAIAEDGSPVDNSGASSEADSTSTTIAQKLQVLDKLKQSGAITEDEYKKQRQEILSGI